MIDTLLLAYCFLPEKEILKSFLNFKTKYEIDKSFSVVADQKLTFMKTCNLPIARRLFTPLSYDTLRKIVCIHIATILDHLHDEISQKIIILNIFIHKSFVLLFHIRI